MQHPQYSMFLDMSHPHQLLSYNTIGSQDLERNISKVDRPFLSTRNELNFL